MTKYYHAMQGEIILHVMSFDEFVYTEVFERENYRIAEVKAWIEKYNLIDRDRVLWVSPDKFDANGYNLLASDWERRREIPIDEVELAILDDETDGFIIPESDDGDNGFLFVIRPPQKQGENIHLGE